MRSVCCTCYSHYPQTKATVVAETPELARLTQASKNQSQVHSTCYQSISCTVLVNSCIICHTWLFATLYKSHSVLALTSLWSVIYFVALCLFSIRLRQRAWYVFVCLGLYLISYKSERWTFWWVIAFYCVEMLLFCLVTCDVVFEVWKSKVKFWMLHQTQADLVLGDSDGDIELHVWTVLGKVSWGVWEEDKRV